MGGQTNLTCDSDFVGIAPPPGDANPYTRKDLSWYLGTLMAPGRFAQWNWALVTSGLAVPFVGLSIFVLVLQHRRLSVKTLSVGTILKAADFEPSNSSSSEG